MPTKSKQRLQLLLGKSFDRDSTPDAASPENPGSGHATITLLEISGVGCKSAKNKRASDVVPKMKKELSRRLERVARKDVATSACEGTDGMVAENESDIAPKAKKQLSGRLELMARNEFTTSEDEGNDDWPLAVLPYAKVVVWFLENKTASRKESMPKYFSGYMKEESMDEEEKKNSWGCVWPSKTSSFSVPLPMMNENSENSVISLGLGLKLPGQDEIKTLGSVTVSIPGAKVGTTEATQPSPQKMVLSIPVKPLKKRTLPSEFVQMGTKKYGCSVTPSTMLKLELQLDRNRSASAESALSLSCSSCETKSIQSDASVECSIAYQVRVYPTSNDAKAVPVLGEDANTDDDLSTVGDSPAIVTQYILEASPAKTRTDALDVGVTAPSDESHDAKLSEEGCEIAKVSNKTPSDESEKFYIDFAAQKSTSTVSPKCVAGDDLFIHELKNERIINSPELSGSASPQALKDSRFLKTPRVSMKRHLKKHVFKKAGKQAGQPAQLSKKDDKQAGQPGQPSTIEDMGCQTSLAEIQFNYSSVSNNGCVGNWGAPPKDKRKNKRPEQKSNAERGSSAEANGCVATLTEVYDDVVEGLEDIVANGFFVEEDMFPFGDNSARRRDLQGYR